MTSDDRQLSFGQRLRRQRKALDLTQIELAARVPCAKGTIRRIEADDLRPSKALAERLADILLGADTSHDAVVRFARSGVVARRRLADLLGHAPAQGLGATADYGRALLGAGILAFFDGDVAAAQPHCAEARALGAQLAEAFGLHHEIGNTMGMAECLNGLVTTLLALKRPEPAALLLGALDALLASLRVPLVAAEQAHYQQTATALHALLERQSSEQQRLAGSTITFAAVTRFVVALAGEEAVP